ncbi:unnamed protein product, partial [Mesorhabditis belari]|uniref:Protein kinase domain-containing protein n=1 Tax=Mesorhabditis belari TaxID=2138241 RepID=A0AAF3FR29_9BILA
MDDPSFIFLGSGSQGCVGLIGGHPRIAAKFTRKDSNARVVAFSKECEALQILRHQNIIQYFGFDDDNPVYNVIRMEYCERGSLSAVLNDPTIVYSMKTVFCWCEHLLAALVYLEENGIVHRDIKPSNVLVKQDWVLKLADFGCVRDLFQKMNTSSVATLTGTYRYMSPEAYGIYRRKTFKRKINSLNDLYAIGLVIWEIVERRLEAIDCVNEELKKLVLRCTHPQPKQRPTINEAYNVARAQNHSHLTNNFEPIIDKNQSLMILKESDANVTVQVKTQAPTSEEFCQNNTGTPSCGQYQITAKSSWLQKRGHESTLELREGKVPTS